MKKFIDPFLYNASKLDIHGYDRCSAVSMIMNFINCEYRVGNKKLVIVHGHGEGILRKATQDYLKNDKRVLEYRLDIFNDGQTIVILK